MAGVKSLLKAAASDMEQTARVQNKPSETVVKEKENIKPIIDVSANTSASSTKSKDKTKNPGGRRTNKEKGIKSRKQYTLTLTEDTYELIYNSAIKDGLSFAKFMERAALEYIKNHQ